MAGKSTILHHPQRGAIDAAIISRTPLREIADAFGVSKSTLHRYISGPFLGKLLEARAAREVAEADHLLARMETLYGEAEDVLACAKTAENHPLRLQAIDRAVKLTELLAKLEGRLRDRVSVNVLVSPQFLSVQAKLVAALEGFPEAREAVLQALDAAETADARSAQEVP